MGSEEKSEVEKRLQDLQKMLGKKNLFEESVSSIRSLLLDHYPSSSPSLRKSIYSVVCRVATILQTRYTAPGFWLAGLQLFEEAESLVTEPSAKAHLKTCIARAREHLHEEENKLEVPENNTRAGILNCLMIYSVVCRVATILQTRYTAPGFWLAGLQLFEEAESLVTEPSAKAHLKTCIARAREHLHEEENKLEVPENNTRAGSRFLFEGHLTVGPEPPPPAWLVAQNFLTTLAATQERASESSRGQGENSSTSESTNSGHALQDMINTMQEINGLQDLESVIEASLQEIGAGPQRPPPASKEVVAKLPIITVTDEILERLGNETQCAVCRENLVINDKMQELPCKHLFHPNCLKPWLDEHNSCPICRHELQTDDHAYESWKEREKEAEEERKGAANAVRGGEYMYV